MNFKATRKAIMSLVSDADYANCAITLEVAGTGATMKLRKDTRVAGATAIYRGTDITLWLDKNDPGMDEKIQKAFYALP